MLYSRLCGPAKDLSNDILFSEIESDDDVDKICKALHKKDALSLISVRNREM